MDREEVLSKVDKKKKKRVAVGIVVLIVLVSFVVYLKVVPALKQSVSLQIENIELKQKLIENKCPECEKCDNSKFTAAISTTARTVIDASDRLGFKILLGLGLIYLLQMIVKTGKETAEVFAFVYISIKKGVLFIKKLWKGGK